MMTCLSSCIGKTHMSYRSLHVTLSPQQFPKENHLNTGGPMDTLPTYMGQINDYFICADEHLAVIKRREMAFYCWPQAWRCPGAPPQQMRQKKIHYDNRQKATDSVFVGDWLSSVYEGAPRRAVPVLHTVLHG